MLMTLHGCWSASIDWLIISSEIHVIWTILLWSGLFIEVVWRSWTHLAIWYPIHVHRLKTNVQKAVELKSAGCVRKQLQTSTSHLKMKTICRLLTLSASIAGQADIRVMVCVIWRILVIVYALNHGTHVTKRVDLTTATTTIDWLIDYDWLFICHTIFCSQKIGKIKLRLPLCE